jgi:hypothetical protein
MTSQWQPYREPLRITILRTGLIAILGGVVLAGIWGGLARWRAAALLILWPSFGGHWVELWFLNWLRPRLPVARGVQIVSRLAVWFLAGTALAIGMFPSPTTLGAFRPRHWPEWWFGGLAFIGIELIAHLALQLRRLPSFYNGRG